MCVCIRVCMCECPHLCVLGTGLTVLSWKPVYSAHTPCLQSLFVFSPSPFLVLLFLLSFILSVFRRISLGRFLSRSCSVSSISFSSRPLVSVGGFYSLSLFPRFLSPPLTLTLSTPLFLLLSFFYLFPPLFCLFLYLFSFLGHSFNTALSHSFSVYFFLFSSPSFFLPLA